MGAEVSKKLVTKEEGEYTYTGEIMNELPSGNGHLVNSKTGMEYWGEWAFGKFNGKGTYHYEKGTYEGEFKDGLFHG